MINRFPSIEQNQKRIRTGLLVSAVSSGLIVLNALVGLIFSKVVWLTTFTGTLGSAGVLAFIGGISLAVVAYLRIKYPPKRLDWIDPLLGYSLGAISFIFLLAIAMVFIAPVVVGTFWWAWTSYMYAFALYLKRGYDNTLVHYLKLKPQGSGAGNPAIEFARRLRTRGEIIGENVADKAQEFAARAEPIFEKVDVKSAEYWEKTTDVASQYWQKAEPTIKKVQEPTVDLIDKVWAKIGPTIKRVVGKAWAITVYLAQKAWPHIDKADQKVGELWGTAKKVAPEVTSKVSGQVVSKAKQWLPKK